MNIFKSIFLSFALSTHPSIRSACSDTLTPSSEVQRQCAHALRRQCAHAFTLRCTVGHRILDIPPSTVPPPETSAHLVECTAGTFLNVQCFPVLTLASSRENLVSARLPKSSIFAKAPLMSCSRLITRARSSFFLAP